MESSNPQNKGINKTKYLLHKSFIKFRLFSDSVLRVSTLPLVNTFKIALSHPKTGFQFSGIGPFQHEQISNYKDLSEKNPPPKNNTIFKFFKHDKYHILAKTTILVLPKISGSMSVIYLLLALSIIVALIFFIAFIISVRNGQYDDSYTPSVRMLFEDELVKNGTEKNQKKKTNQLNESQIL